MPRKAIFIQKHTQEQLAYFAGIADARGCFFIGAAENGTLWKSMIQIAIYDETVIQWITKTFGGTMCVQYRKIKGKTVVNPIYNWRATGEMLDYLLPKIFPFLIVKKQQCEIMIQYRLTTKNIGNKKIPIEVHEKRVELMRQIKNINSRFHDNP